MILEFATKRNRNGLRKYLGINTETMTYSRERGHWYSREDIVEISLSDLRKLEAQCERLHYVKLPHLFI